MLNLKLKKTQSLTFMLFIHGFVAPFGCPSALWSLFLHELQAGLNPRTIQQGSFLMLPAMQVLLMAGFDLFRLLLPKEQCP